MTEHEYGSHPSFSHLIFDTGARYLVNQDQAY